MGKQLRLLAGHLRRVPALAWARACLASGSRDRSVILHDVRVADAAVQRLRWHRSEVCGLRVSAVSLSCGSFQSRVMCLPLRQSFHKGASSASCPSHKFESIKHVHRAIYVSVSPFNDRLNNQRLVIVILSCLVASRSGRQTGISWPAAATTTRCGGDLLMILLRRLPETAVRAVADLAGVR